MRGEFVSASGLVIPNNVTYAGRGIILASAFRNTVPSFWLGLITGAPDLDLLESNTIEPTIGVNGYARQQLTRDVVGWPTIADVGNETMIESKLVTFAPTGLLDQSIQRLALFTGSARTPSAPIIAVSALLPAPIQLNATTALALRQFKYRFYL